MKQSILMITLLLLTPFTWAQDFKMQAYFKDDMKNRVMSFGISDNTTAQQAKKHAQRQPYTPGQVTAVYYYRPSQYQPKNGFNLEARNYNHAQQLIDGFDQPTFASMRYLNGNFEFVDCTSDKSWMCRNE
jgi:hypothetical protein